MNKKKLLFLGLLTAVSISAASCGKAWSDDRDDSVKTEGNTELILNNEADSEVLDVPEETESKEEVVHSIGESVALNDWEIAITDVKVVESVSSDYMKYEPKEEGNKYAQLFITVQNKGKESDRFLPSFGYNDDVFVKLFYGDGYEFSSTQLLGYSNDLHDSSINPLSSRSGEVVFEIPESVASASDEVIIKFISGENSISFKIR